MTTTTTATYVASSLTIRVKTRVKKVPATGEYCAILHVDGAEIATYFTDCPIDARETSSAMRKHYIASVLSF